MPTISQLVRAGRKQIVNLKWIERVDVGVAGGLVVTLRGGRTVETSRRQSARLRGAFEPVGCAPVGTIPAVELSNRDEQRYQTAGDENKACIFRSWTAWM